MKRIFTVIGILWIFLMVNLTSGCNNAKALTTIRDADNLAAEMLVYIHAIAKANNDAFEKKDIPLALHHATNEAASKALDAVNIFVKAIATAKAAVTAGSSPTGQLDLLKALFNKDTVTAVLALISAISVNAIPAALQVSLGGWAAALQGAISVFRMLFAQMDVLVQEESHAA